MDIAVASSGVRIELGADGSPSRGARWPRRGGGHPDHGPGGGAALVGQAAAPRPSRRREAAAAAAKPIDDMRGGIAQRKHLAKILTIRALEGALQRYQEAR